MDFEIITLVFGCLLSYGSFAYFSETYGNYSFILADVYASNILGGSSLHFAQEWCKNHAFGYTLATAPDEDAHTRLKEFIRAANNSDQISSSDLILLNGKLHVPLPSNWTWINGKPLQRGIFGHRGENLTQDYYYGFVIYYHNVGSASARSYFPYICEYSGNCSMDDIGISLNDRCYREYYDESTWYEARNKCLKRGGDLASFDNFNKTTFRVHSFRKCWYLFREEESWVGLHHHEWRWQDADNKQITYTNWINGHPGGFHECLCLQSVPTNDAWLWKSCSCESTCRFICSSFTNAPKHETAPGHDNCSSGFSAGIGVGISIGFGVLIILATALLVIYLKRGKRMDCISKQGAPYAVYDNFPESQSQKI